MLSGNSINNKTWIKKVETEAADLFEETKIPDYDHWSSGKELIDFDLERKKLPSLVEGWGDYLVFAKSVGTLLTLAGTADGALQPRAALFCGFPKSFSDRVGFAGVNTAWSKVNYPVTILQNELDPAGSYEEMDRYVKGIGKDIEVVKTQGDTHDYEDYADIKARLEKLLRS